MEVPCLDSEKKGQSRTKKCCIWFAVFFLAALGIGFGGGWWMYAYVNQKDTSQEGDGVVRENSSEYHFVNPLLECDIGSDVISKNRPMPSKEKLQGIISDMELQGRASFVSVYYRDLNNGPWISIHPHESFYPASLLKLPIMMYYYRQAEADPSMLSRKVTIGQLNPSSNDAYYKPQQNLKEGDEYTVDELIRRMIIYSDNNAAKALMNLAQPTDPIHQVFQDVRLQKDAPDVNSQMNIINYGVLLRVLFNASYLNPEYSERALTLLSQTTFTQGITGKLPGNLTISHKFGERESDDGTRQLHDCGIVYKTNFPYLICVMTRGTDIEKLSSVIQDLSKEVYNEISQDGWKL